MSDETKKTQESELSDEQLENASGGDGTYFFDEFESFRTPTAAQDAETQKTMQDQTKKDTAVDRTEITTVRLTTQ